MMTPQEFAAVAIPVVAVLALIAHYWRSRVLLNRWAAERGYTIVFAEYRHLFKGPFFMRSGRGSAVYKITVKDRSGRTRSGYARCGSYWLGMWLTNEVMVHWDD